jgi:hypothetical protein
MKTIQYIKTYFPNPIGRRMLRQLPKAQLDHFVRDERAPAEFINTFRCGWAYRNEEGQAFWKAIEKLYWWEWDDEKVMPKREQIESVFESHNIPYA